MRNQQVNTSFMLVNKATKNDFNSLIGKAFKTAQKSKQFVVDVARNLNQPVRDLMGWQMLEQPERQITQYLIDKFNSLRHIEEPQAAAITLIHKFFNALDVAIEGKLKSQFEDLVKKILQPSAQSENVANIWHQNVKTYDCICGMVHKQGEQAKEEVCYKCGKICHPSCFWQREATDKYFECPVCFLLNCIPQKKVKEVIFLGYCRFTGKQRTNHTLKFFIDMKSDPHQHVEIRSCRLNKKSKYQITFPQYCNLYLSNFKLTQFRPLPHNSPLKRRSDEEVPINKFTLSYLNTLTIEEKNNLNSQDYRISPSDHHIILIANTESISKIKLERLYLQRKLSIEDSKKKLNQYLTKNSNGLVVDKLTLSMKCQYYRTNIVHPARSKHCTTHYQPFDLLNFISASLNSKNSVQKWRCPICKKRAYDLLTDQYLFSMVQGKNNVADITFKVGEDPIIRESEPEEEDREECIVDKRDNKGKDNNIQIEIDCVGSKDKKSVSINPVVIDIVDSQDEREEQNRKRAFDPQNKESLNAQGRKTNKPFENTNKQVQSLPQNKGKLSSKEIILQKLKQKITQINQSNPKQTIPNQQKIIQNTVASLQKHSHSPPKGFERVNPIIQILEQQPVPLKKNCNQDLIKTQQQLLNQANSLLMKGSCSITTKDQITFNRICSKLINLRIVS